jgi:hypothetical protein
VRALSRELGVTETTIRRWKRAGSRIHDGSHTRHDLGQSTSLTEETLIVGLRQDVGLGLDDMEYPARCQTLPWRANQLRLNRPLLGIFILI